METNTRYSKFTEESEGGGDKYNFDYRKAIGSLMYLAVCRRPDIAFPVGTLSRFVSNSTRKFCAAVKESYEVSCWYSYYGNNVHARQLEK